MIFIFIGGFLFFWSIGALIAKNVWAGAFLPMAMIAGGLIVVFLYVVGIVIVGTVVGDPAVGMAVRN